MNTLMGVVGLHGSGKGAFGEYLARSHNFTHKDIGQVLRDELKASGRNYLDRNEMHAMANERRTKYGRNYWCKRILDSVKSGDLVITSIHNMGEVDEIVSRGGVIVEVFADQKTRFERTVGRVRNDPSKHGDIKSFEEFKAKEEKELRNDDPSKQQLMDCINAAKYRIDNNGSLDHLHKEIEELLALLKAKGKLSAT
jgi:dephospho-CoA kinase